MHVVFNFSCFCFSTLYCCCYCYDPAAPATAACCDDYDGVYLSVRDEKRLKSSLYMCIFTLHLKFPRNTRAYSTRFLLTAAYIFLKCSNANTLCTKRNGVDMEHFQCKRKCWSVIGLVHMARKKIVGINEIDRKTTKKYSQESWDPVAHILYYIEKSSHISTAMV